ncbi:MAG: gliding motility-associated C-terminal domain-containing protein, partial [Flavobacteriales bacterium]
DTWVDLIYYVDNGCSDTIFIYNKLTDIPLDTAYMCLDNDLIPLIEDVVGQLPWAGVWEGNGVTNPYDDDYYEFDPVLAGIGDHLLSYEVNGCADSLRLYVFPTELQQDSFALCSNEPPFVLDNSVNEGGTWTGPGVVDMNTGLFDPNLAPEDDFYVVWSTPAACSDSILITIEEFQQATIGNIQDVYCFENNDYLLDFSPSGGDISGAIDTDQLNPSALGEGTFEVHYEYVGDFCFTDTSMSFSIFPPLSISLSAADTILCDNGGTNISVEGNGGQPNANYTFTWSDGLFSLPSNNVSPEGTQYYYVSVDDGCSDQQTDSVLITILPPISPQVILSDTVCFGEPGFAEASVSQPGDYSIEWDNSNDNPYNTTAGDIINLNIIDNNQGCEFDSLVFVPSYTPVSAGFSSNPNADCIPWELQPIQFIDLSNHGISGLWDFGNEEIAAYDSANNPSISYDAPGEYNISLYIENEGACADSASISICIEDPAKLFVPDIFSPNGDGLNDLLFVRGRGLAELNFQIFDRWGDQIFTSNNVDFGWDGRFRGSKMPTGVYVYMLRAKLSDGTILEQNGDITLVR